MDVLGLARVLYVRVHSNWVYLRYATSLGLICVTFLGTS